MITKFKIFEGIYDSIINKCDSYILINGDYESVIKTLKLINKNNINKIFGNALLITILDDLKLLIAKLEEEAYYLSDKVIGIFLIHIPYYVHKSLKYIQIRKEIQKHKLIDKHSEKFTGELKFINGEPFLDTLIKDVKNIIYKK